jgi:hypothetical protein
MTQTDSTVEFTRDELIAEIDRDARKTVGMSAGQLAIAYRARTLLQPWAVADLIALLNLLPDNDPLFEAK